MQAIEAKLTTDRTVRLGTVTVGGSRPILIAGPCAVEPDYVEAAGRLAALGVACSEDASSSRGPGRRVSRGWARPDWSWSPALAH